MSNRSVAPSPSTRESRGLEIFRSGGVTRIDRAGLYMVQSRTRRRVEYLVDLPRESCECEDHKRTGLPCLHVYAALLFRAWILRTARTVIHSGGW